MQFVPAKDSRLMEAAIKAGQVVISFNKGNPTTHDPPKLTRGLRRTPFALLEGMEITTPYAEQFEAGRELVAFLAGLVQAGRIEPFGEFDEAKLPSRFRAYWDAWDAQDRQRQQLILEADIFIVNGLYHVVYKASQARLLNYMYSALENDEVDFGIAYHPTGKFYTVGANSDQVLKVDSNTNLFYGHLDFYRALAAKQDRVLVRYPFNFDVLTASILLDGSSVIPSRWVQYVHAVTLYAFEDRPWKKGLPDLRSVLPTLDLLESDREGVAHTLLCGHDTNIPNAEKKWDGQCGIIGSPKGDGTQPGRTALSPEHILLAMARCFPTVAGTKASVELYRGQPRPLLLQWSRLEPREVNIILP